MKIFAYDSFRKFYRKLPNSIQQKVDKSLQLLSENIRHPSLHVKKIQGTHGLWEARVDYQYRMSFELRGDSIYMRVVGNHDDVLKKP